jgi:hypothetical protein
VTDDSVPAPDEAPASAAPLGAFDLLLAQDSESSRRETAEDAAARSLTPLGTAGIPVQLEGGSGALGLERHEQAEVRATGIFDWVSLALSIVAPPVGVLAAIAAIVLGVRRNGFAATVAKIALIVGAILTVVLIVVLFLAGDAQKKQAAHDAIAASSVQFCTQLKASGDLSSSTYGFPASQDTIPDSIAAIHKYDDFWTGLVKVSPKGIRSGTQLVATAASGIFTTVSTTRIMDDGSNTTRMEQAASNSGINDWVSSYCK